MGDHIQAMHIPISTKNIGIPSQFEYKKTLIFRIEHFIRRLRWFCLSIGPPFFHPIFYHKSNEKSNDTNTSQKTQNLDESLHEDEDTEFEGKQNFVFKSEKSPPVIKELIYFEEQLYKLARNLQFRKI